MKFYFSKAGSAEAPHLSPHLSPTFQFEDRVCALEEQRRSNGAMQLELAKLQSENAALKEKLEQMARPLSVLRLFAWPLVALLIFGVIYHTVELPSTRLPDEADVMFP